jgi:hypothetical protein
VVDALLVGDVCCEQVRYATCLADHSDEGLGRGVAAMSVDPHRPSVGSHPTSEGRAETAGGA